MKGTRQRRLASRRDAENAEKKKEIKPCVSPCLRVSASPRVVEIKKVPGKEKKPLPRLDSHMQLIFIQSDQIEAHMHRNEPYVQQIFIPILPSDKHVQRNEPHMQQNYP